MRTWVSFLDVAGEELSSGVQSLSTSFMPYFAAPHPLPKRLPLLGSLSSEVKIRPGSQLGKVMGRQPGALVLGATQHWILQAERLPTEHPVPSAAPSSLLQPPEKLLYPFPPRRGPFSPICPDNASQCPQSPRGQEDWSACSFSFWFAGKSYSRLPCLSAAHHHTCNLCRQGLLNGKMIGKRQNGNTHQS